MTDALDLWVRPDEQCVALTADFRVFQRLRGHRYSVDDMLVGQLACSRVGAPARVLDLGCGLASVLLMVAWHHPHAHLVGIEAQREHTGLARRNVLLNGCEGRAEIHDGDLRDEVLLDRLGSFDLITGTPPYFDPRAATVCKDPQRAYAQWELRGGIEAYARAAARTLAAGGSFVTCASAGSAGGTERARRALQSSGLTVTWWREVLPREDRAPFLSLWIATRESASSPEHAAPLVLRLTDGRRSEEHKTIREWFGIPCSEY